MDGDLRALACASEIHIKSAYNSYAASVGSYLIDSVVLQGCLELVVQEGSKGQFLGLSGAGLAWC